MLLNPSKSFRQPDTCACTDVMVSDGNHQMCETFVLPYGCAMMVNGDVIAVPPHNHRMAAAAQ